MIKLSDLGQVYIVCGKTDMRRGIDSWGADVEEEYHIDPEKDYEFSFKITNHK